MISNKSEKNNVRHFCRYVPEPCLNRIKLYQFFVAYISSLKYSKRIVLLHFFMILSVPSQNRTLAYLKLVYIFFACIVVCFQLANSRAKRIMANQSIIALLVYLYYELLIESRVSFIHVRYNETGFYKRDLPRPVLASKQQPQHGIIKSTFFTFFFLQRQMKFQRKTS